jgi:hypothetical protein
VGDGPVAHKHTEPGSPPPFGQDGVRGEAGALRYDLRWTAGEPPLRHLPADWLYRAPLPRTKLESPVPAAALSGEVAIGDRAFRLDGWPGMVGHNWGAQHAERWIWLHGTAFADAPGAWLDLALGRVKLGPATTPWVANGALSVGGRRLRLGGPRRARVVEDPLRVDVSVPVAGGGQLELTAHAPRAHVVVWRYADPDGGEHHTSNCSVAALVVVLRPPGGVPLTLSTGHGGAYELGMRETTHGLPVQPFSDP